MRLTAVLSRDVGLSNFVKTESENRCANSVKLIDEKIVEMDKDLRCSYVGRKNLVSTNKCCFVINFP
jgi:hypothetical protein